MKNKTRNKTSCFPDTSIKNDFKQFIQKILYSKTNSFRSLLEVIFKPSDGKIRNTSISIIIGSSKSCFSQLTSSHTYQTIYTLLSSFASINIQYIYVIIATESAPFVLCSEIQSTTLLNYKSSFWPSLFSCLSQQNPNYCNLESALHAAYDINRMRSTDAQSYMFVLTDLFNQPIKIKIFFICDHIFKIIFILK